MPTDKNKSHLNLFRSAQALIILRIILITIFLGAVIAFQQRMNKNYPIDLITGIIIFTYLLTIVYAISLKFIKRLRIFCHVQIIGDLLIETAVIYSTGGMESVFSFLYTLTVISASIVLVRPSNYITAALASFFYGFIAYSEGNSFSPNENVFFLYKLFLNFLAFFLVAYLSGYLGEKLRTTGQELKQKSENLTALKKFHERIVESMSSGLIITDLEGNIASFNKAAEYITGFNLSDVIGMPLKAIFGFLPNNTTINKNSFFRLKGYAEKKGGKKIFVGLSASSLKDDQNNIKGFIITFQDLTNLKDMEEKVARAERFAAIGQVAAGIAHEIRNPLASMSGSIQVLKNELKLEDSNKQLMEIVLKETDRLNSIITQFLTYARSKPVNVTKTNITEIIKETVMILKNSPDYNSNMEIIIDSPEDVFAEIDEKQIRQVFFNLSINSFHAISKSVISNQSKGILTISSHYKKHTAESTAKRVIISFEDNGCGMSDDTINKIFDPFYTTKDIGTGLGLAIVYRIIENHAGTIDVKSEQGKGTDFIISLPVNVVI